MGFIFKAGFWIAAVAAFLPAGLAPSLDDFPLPENGSQVDAQEVFEDFCKDRLELCMVGEEAATLARDYALPAFERATEAVSKS